MPFSEDTFIQIDLAIIMFLVILHGIDIVNFIMDNIVVNICINILDFLDDLLSMSRMEIATNWTWIFNQREQFFSTDQFQLVGTMLYYLTFKMVFHTPHLTKEG